MILIRGIKGKEYAKKVEKGLVGCRDVLSALLEPPITGYAFSDYYEKNLVKALSFCWNGRTEKINNPELLYALLIDHFIPYIYITYFHVLNEKSLEWLNNFDDDYYFIAVDVQLDKLTKTAIGSEYFGAKMRYVNSIDELKQESYNPFQVACMCSIEGLFQSKKQISIPLMIYNTLAFALLCREVDEKFTDIENEFRIIAFDCPRIVNEEIRQIQRETEIIGKSGIKYKGILNAGINTIFESNARVLSCCKKSLRDVVFEEKGNITLESRFKEIDIRDISDRYCFIGSKIKCEKFIRKELQKTQQERYVEKTKINSYNIDDLKNVAYSPSHICVEY